LPGSPFNAPVAEEPADSYEPRDLVSHDKYGLGSVLEVENQAAVVVDFGTHRRRIMLPCARLVKL
jgi:predicted RNA-binding protein (virulence factor B family)